MVKSVFLNPLKFFWTRAPDAAASIFTGSVSVGSVASASGLGNLGN